MRLLVFVLFISNIMNAQQMNFNCIAPDYSSIDYVRTHGDIEANEDLLYEITDFFFQDMLYFTGSVNLNDYDVTVEYYPFTGEWADAAALNSVCEDEDGKKHILIEVNKNRWYIYNDYLKKLFLMYHELGHGVLLLEHNCTQMGEIMNTVECVFDDRPLKWPNEFPVYTESEFRESVGKMFEGSNQTYFIADTCN